MGTEFPREADGLRICFPSGLWRRTGSCADWEGVEPLGADPDDGHRRNRGRCPSSPRMTAATRPRLAGRRTSRSLSRRPSPTTAEREPEGGSGGASWRDVALGDGHGRGWASYAAVLATLMTLHSRQGPGVSGCVFLAGMEEGHLSPFLARLVRRWPGWRRSGRLCYVGIAARPQTAVHDLRPEPRALRQPPGQRALPLHRRDPAAGSRDFPRPDRSGGLSRRARRMVSLRTGRFRAPKRPQRVDLAHPPPKCGRSLRSRAIRRVKPA